MISNTQQAVSFIQEPRPDSAFQEAPLDFSDSTASICWFPDDYEKIVACSSWDSRVHICQITPYSSPSDQFTSFDTLLTEYPCISLAWDVEARGLIGGAIDGSIYMIDVATRLISTIGKHDDAVKGVFCSDRVVCSIGYDKTLKFWDLRAQNQCTTFQLGAKAVCCDMLFPTVAIGLENEKLLIFDVLRDLYAINNNPAAHYIDSPLGNGSQLSAVSISKDNTIGIGTYDGRSNISKIQRGSFGAALSNVVTFKAHKADSEDPNIKIMYPVHAVGLHPTNKNSYFTAGGDGGIYFWDVVSKAKIMNISCGHTPITAAKLSPFGKYLAYGIGYDWAKGIEGSQSIKPKFRIHTMQQNELAKND